MPHIIRNTSLASKAIAHLRTLPVGSRVATYELAAVIGAQGDNLANSLSSAVKNGLLCRDLTPTVGKRSVYLWSLPDHRTAPEPNDAFSRLAYTQLGRQQRWRPLGGVEREEEPEAV